MADAAHAVIDAFLAGDVDEMAAVLGPDGVFHSPVADYRGRDRFVPVLRALSQIMTSVSVTSVLHDSDQSVAFFTGTIGGLEADGVLKVTAGPHPHAGEVTLMVRPLAALLVGVEQMKEALGATSRSR